MNEPKYKVGDILYYIERHGAHRYVKVREVMNCDSGWGYRGLYSDNLDLVINSGLTESSSGLMYEDQVFPAKFTKSPLWRLMNGYED
jgi:hypothetical protein